MPHIFDKEQGIRGGWNAPLIKIKLSKGAVAPTRAHTYDAGMDLYTPEDVEIPASTCKCHYDGDYGGCVHVGSAVIDTGVHLAIPEGFVGLIKSKSGLNVKQGLTGEGVIDAHYTGSICVKLYNHTDEVYYFKAGDKIAQLVIVPCLLPRLELVDHLEETDRGDNGFGSTGR